MNQYLKATLWTAGIYMLVTLAFLYLGYVGMQSPEWDTNDSSAVQGFAFMCLATLSALTCVVVAFPLIAKKLQPNFTARKWVYLNILVVWLVSFLVACVFCYYVGTPSAATLINEALILSLLLTIIGLALLLPAMFIWLRLAKMNLSI